MEKALSDEYYKLRSSRDFYTGTSFKMSTWDLNTRYFNDENIIDFVSYEGCLLYCTRSHISSESNEPVPIIENDIIVGIHPNIFWKFVMGTNGKGLKGDKGDSVTGPKGDKGDPGAGVIPGGTTGQALVKKSNTDYDTEWKTISGGGEIPNFDAEVASVSSTTQANANVVLEGDVFKFSFGLPKGADGKDGQDGKDGTNGSKGQIIYPEGIYNVDTIYQGTVDKTPYVYDSNDANYYVLNIVGTWQGTLHNNESPSTDTSSSWVKLEAFEALYTKVGIIGNGLIGSAVFNDVYMFSQQGVDENGDVSTHYENFNKDSIGTPIESTDPTKPGVRTFIPNMLFNFETGTGYLAGGNLEFTANGDVVQKYSTLIVGKPVTTHTVDKFFIEISSNAVLNSTDINTIDLNYTELGLTPNKSYRGSIRNNLSMVPIYVTSSKDHTHITYTPGNPSKGSASTSLVDGVLIPPHMTIDFSYTPGTYVGGIFNLINTAGWVSKNVMQGSERVVQLWYVYKQNYPVYTEGIINIKVTGTTATVNRAVKNLGELSLTPTLTWDITKKRFKLDLNDDFVFNDAAVTIHQSQVGPTDIFLPHIQAYEYAGSIYIMWYDNSGSKTNPPEEAWITIQLQDPAY